MGNWARGPGAAEASKAGNSLATRYAGQAVCLAFAARFMAGAVALLELVVAKRHGGATWNTASWEETTKGVPWKQPPSCLPTKEELGAFLKARRRSWPPTTEDPKPHSKPQVADSTSVEVVFVLFGLLR